MERLCKFQFVEQIKTGTAVSAVSVFGVFCDRLSVQIKLFYLFFNRILYIFISLTLNFYDIAENTRESGQQNF